MTFLIGKSLNCIASQTTREVANKPLNNTEERKRLANTTQKLSQSRKIIHHSLNQSTSTQNEKLLQ